MQIFEVDLKEELFERNQIVNYIRFFRERIDNSKVVCEEMESKRVLDDDDILYEFDNSELCLSDGDDLIEKEIFSIKFFVVDVEFLDLLMLFVVRKYVIYKLLFSLDEEECELKKFMNNFIRFKEKLSVLLMSSLSLFV